MTKPPTMAEAHARGLVAQPFTKGARQGGIHTFSNGTEWDLWAEPNCFSCRYWDKDTAGALCAFEAAAFLDMVTPELASLFGWIQRETKYGPQSGWDAPESCRFFADREDSDGNDIPPAPEPDPRQFVLFGDPTEDAAIFAFGPVDVPVPLAHTAVEAG